jgi:hypothetical protein
MTNLEATIGPKGVSAVDLVPLAREHAMDGATLGADTLTRLEGCR